MMMTAMMMVSLTKIMTMITPTGQEVINTGSQKSHHRSCLSLQNHDRNLQHHCPRLLCLHLISLNYCNNCHKLSFLPVNIMAREYQNQLPWFKQQPITSQGSCTMRAARQGCSQKPNAVSNCLDGLLLPRKIQEGGRAGFVTKSIEFQFIGHTAVQGHTL